MITNNKKERITSQKKIILDYLRSVDTHPSAKGVYLAVKKKLPRISMATVYRVLKKLEERGEIQEINCDVSRYDGDNSFHIHFICEKCRKVFDIPEDDDLLKKKRTKVGEIKNYKVYFYGICKKCQKK